MPNPSAYSPRRATKTRQVGKTKNTGLIFQFLITKDLLAMKSYYNDSSRFLVTSTTGSNQAGYDVNPYIVSEDFNTSVINTFTKPFLLDSVRPFNTAPVANAQIDLAELVDITSNDFIKIAYFASYPSATVTYRLSSDNTYTNTISWNITGSSTNIGTVANPQYLTVAYLRTSLGVVVGTPVLTAIIRSRFISVNSTAVNRVAPIMSYAARNTTSLPGEVISWKACCLESYKFIRSLKTASIVCGLAEIGEVATGDSFEMEFEVMEETPQLLAIASGTNAQIANNEVWEQIIGFETGQILNKVVADVIGAPTRGQLQISSGLSLANLQMNCANIELIPYFTGLELNANTYLGSGSASYDPASGFIYFNTQSIGQLPEICYWRNKDLITLIPAPLQLGHTGRIMLIEETQESKKIYYDLKRVQLKFPDMSNEDTGRKLVFKTKVFFSKAGDVKIMSEQ